MADLGVDEKGSSGHETQAAAACGWHSTSLGLLVCMSKPLAKGIISITCKQAAPL